MSQKYDSEEIWVSQMDNLCSSLGVDPGTALKAKESFADIKQNFTLDGDISHWMACALYVACRTATTPTVQMGKALEGNCVSLTKLLRLSNISLMQFFNKIKNWMEMSSMSAEFRHTMARLEQRIAVSTMLYRKFRPIFQEIFSGLQEPIKTAAPKSRRPKFQLCSTNALYELTWCLFVCVKGEFHNSADDLVDMYHVLFACLDFVYGNAFMDRRKDIINASFKGLPQDWLKDDYELPDKTPCIIATLCEIKDGLTVEATTMKEYSFRPVIKSFFEKGILKGNSRDLLEVLDVKNFESNLKSLNNLYETYVLSVGEFDERIFLGEHANEQIGSKSKSSEDEASDVIAAFGPSGKSCPDTPLTGRRYLARRGEQLTPVSEARNSLARLALYLHHARPQPSQRLVALFTECGITDQMVEQHLIKPCNSWMEKFARSLRDTSRSQASETTSFKCNMVTCLYYKVLEHIIREEHRKKPQVSLRMLLSQETYQLAVYACCTEVVLHAYGIHSMKLPKVLQLYGLSAFHFYKVIELVVQAVVDKLSRDVIKHLNAVEEEVLECLVWTSDSPLWEQLANTKVPASAQVYVQESPLRTNNNGVQAMSAERVSGAADNAKKQLFKDPIKPGQSLLVSTNNIKQESSVPPSAAVPAAAGDLVPVPAAPTTPKKNNNSLVLFFRKFYSLAVVRLNDLCTRLKLTDDQELKKKIWTCLEHSIMEQTHLMRDRHLDQILMCAVYVICKVSHNASNQVERTFAEIMRCYRQRPLADNHVYRMVLIHPHTDVGPAERGDLINFYNRVYVQCMQTFALQFTGRHKDECSLSPLPGGRAGGWSPGGRVSDALQLYVKPLTDTPHHHHHLTYRFSRSPAKDLHAINSLLSCEVGGALGLAALKRGADGDGVVKRGRTAGGGVARKLHGLITDRQAIW